MFIIPIGHDKAIYRLPIFTLSVIGLCTAIQLLRTFMFFGGATGELIDLFGYRPMDGLSLGLITCAFVHVGYFHLIGNMLFLWLTGANMEYRWGWKAWGAIYLLGAVVSAASFATLHPNSSTPLVGASGAVAAAMGAFMVCLYNARIRFAYLFFFFFRVRTGTFVAPAYVALPLWFIGEFLSAYFFEASRAGGGGVAYSAHVGGFVFGAAVALVLRLTGYEDKLREAVGSDVFDEDDAFLRGQPGVNTAELAPGRYAGAQRFAMSPPPTAAAHRVAADPLAIGALISVPPASDGSISLPPMRASSQPALRPSAPVSVELSISSAPAAHSSAPSFSPPVGPVVKKSSFPPARALQPAARLGAAVRGGPARRHAARRGLRVGAGARR